MNFYKHGMIFATFLGSCLCIGLLAAALGTKYWTISSAVNLKSPKSDGKIHFGLFRGEKNLNVGIGWRAQRFEVPKDIEGMMYAVWFGTVVCMALGILFSATAAIFAVINTASTPISFLTGISGLYIWNCLAITFQGSALGLWLLQYYKRLRFNVMSGEDRTDFSWTSEGKTDLGFSFWLVAAAVIVQFVNIIFIFSGTKEMRLKKNVKPIIEEKGNGAIMLY